jgi:putative tricarboxylic transport membrane protein
VLGTLIGMFFLALFTPLLGDLALKFGAYEFFWLAVFGVIISATLTGGDPLKGWIAGFVGLFIATIGQDGIHAFERFSFGTRDLAGGISLAGIARTPFIKQRRQFACQITGNAWPG